MPKSKNSNTNPIMPRPKKTSKRKQRRNYSPLSLAPNVVMSRVPSHYPQALGDTTVVPFKFTNLIEIPPSGITTKKLLVLGAGTSTGDYIFLESVCPQFAALRIITSRWILLDLNVEVRATGIGGNANTFIAASYTPGNSSFDNVPGSLTDVSNAYHYCESSLGSVGSFKLSTTDYFNDWRQTSDTDNSDAQAGVIKLYGSGAAGTSIITAGVYTISGVLIFCGFRFPST